MPFVIAKVKGGYKVKKNVIGEKKFFSKNPMTLEQAKRQLKALQINVKHQINLSFMTSVKD